MNEKRKRILVGLAAGTALTLTLGMTAHAEELDDGASIPTPESTSSPTGAPEGCQPSATPTGTGEEESGGEASGTGGEKSGGTTGAGTVDGQSGDDVVTPETPARPL